MGMIYLALTCAFYSVQFVFSKLYQKNSDGSVVASVWMTALYSLYFLVYFGVQINFTPAVTQSSVIYAILYSVCAVGVMISSVTGMNFGKVSTVTTFMLLGGMFLPFLYGVALLGEPLTVTKVAAMIIMIVSLLPNLISNDKNEKTGKKNIIFPILLVTVFVANGAISVITNASQKAEGTVDTESFMFVIAIIQLILTLAFITVSALMRKNGKFAESFFKGIGKEVGLKAVGTGCLFAIFYGVCNSLGNVFSIACVNAGTDASVQFPVISGAVITLTAILAMIFFGEKPGKKDILSICLSVAGVILFIF